MRPRTTALLSLAIFLISSSSAVAAQLPGARRPDPQKGAARPAEGAPKARPADSPQRRVPVAGLHGALSESAENEAEESDPVFDFTARLKSGKRVPMGSSASGATSTLRLADHPRRDDLARWLEDSIRDREIDVALLGGHKYMINSCLGVKASAGEFRLKLENPSVRFENTGIVLRLEIDRVSFSALKIRIRPNPNLLEACSFSKKFEVGGAMEDVRLTLRFDPLYDLERCRIGKWNDLNPEVRIGNLNLKPLQNDLDRMAKNMVEDSLTFALQMAVDGVVSGLGDLTMSAIDQFLEADCPTKAGETRRAVDGLAGTGSGARAGGGARGTSSSGSGAGTASSPGATPAGESAEVEQLLARIAELEARVAELEAGAPPPGGDLRALLAQFTGLLGTLDADELAGLDLQGVLADLLSAVLARSSLGEPRQVLDELTRRVLAPQPDAAEPVGNAERPSDPAAPLAPWTLVPNPELKGRMGRILVRYPDVKLAGNTLTVLLRDDKKVADAYGEAAWELMAGRHDVQVSGVTVSGLEVRAGHDTLVRTGVLVVEMTGSTLVTVFQKGGKEKLCDRYGTLSVGLPAGDYEVEIQGQRAPITVRAGEVARF